MTLPGFAPIFAGWNLWSVWQKNDLDTEIGSIGLDADRRLRVWVEDTADAASGAQLHDLLNPSPKHFDGDEVEIISDNAGLELAAGRESVPGPTLLLDGPATLRFVRFYNRGKETVLAWPHSINYLLEGVYTPSKSNPATNAPPPEAVGQDVSDAAGAAANALGSGLTTIAWIAGGVIAVVLIAKLGRKNG